MTKSPTPSAFKSPVRAIDCVLVPVFHVRAGLAATLPRTKIVDEQSNVSPGQLCDDTCSVTGSSWTHSNPVAHTETVYGSHGVDWPGKSATTPVTPLVQPRASLN